MRTRFATSELATTVTNVSTSMIQGTNGFGFATSDLAISVARAVNDILSILRAKGIMG